MLMSPDPISGKPLSLAQACARLRFRHLQFLDILGQARNLRLTAEQMHITQPAATKILMDIEEILEARLFDRLSRGMRPNELGLFTLRYAASALAGHRKFVDEFNALKQGGHGHLSIGAITGSAAHVLIASVAEIQRLRPLLVLKVLEQSSDQLVVGLAEQKIDLMIGRFTEESQRSQFHYERLSDESLQVVGLAPPTAWRARAGHGRAVALALDPLPHLHCAAQSVGRYLRPQRPGPDLGGGRDPLFSVCTGDDADHRHAVAAAHGPGQALHRQGPAGPHPRRSARPHARLRHADTPGRDTHAGHAGLHGGVAGRGSGLTDAAPSPPLTATHHPLIPPTHPPRPQPARSSMACSSTLQPAVMCSGWASSISLWLMPSLQGMKIMPVGASLAM